MDQMPSSTVSQTVSNAFNRIFGRADETAPAPSGELARYSAAIQAVRDVMLRHAIEPNPANYELVYRHVVMHEPRLEEAMSELIRTGYAPTSLNAVSGISDEDLRGIIEGAQENLVAIEAMVEKSSKDAKGFGDALEGGANAMADQVSNPAVESLIKLTRKMIERTRAAEEELRFRSRTMTNLKMSLSEAQIQADTDALTGLSNRRAFERMLGAGGARALMSGQPMSLAICDIDHFKNVNDTYGHDVGDRVLQFVSGVLQENCGKQGMVSRHGGEEFVVIFENKSPDSAYEIIDAARRDLEQRHIVNKDTNEPIHAITFSAGVSTLDASGDVGHLLRAADRALYRAKAGGRNCVVMGGYESRS